MKYSGKILSLLFIMLALPTVGRAQDDQPKLKLKLIRNFGYGGFGKIQGSFTARIQDPPDGLMEVQFYLDDELMAEARTAPFEYKFHTGDFEVGEHTILVTGVLTDGVELQSESISTVFISSEQAWAETQRLIIPLLLLVAILTLIGAGIPLVWGRKKDFTVGRYGPAGGAVCPRCELPFSRSIFSPNLLVGKLVRCPHCGKFSLRAPASSDQHRSEYFG